jgi:hypothetical protein
MTGLGLASRMFLVMLMMMMSDRLYASQWILDSDISFTIRGQSDVSQNTS